MASQRGEFLPKLGGTKPIQGATPLGTVSGENRFPHLSDRDQSFIERLLTRASNSEDVASLEFERTSMGKDSFVVRVYFHHR